MDAIADFLAQAELARPEALRILGLMADTAEEESVRAAAREVMKKGIYSARTGSPRKTG